MKIIIVQDYLRNGGTERQSVLLANAFAAAGHESNLLTFRPDGVLERNVNRNVRRVVLQQNDGQLDWFAPGLVGAVGKMKPDVILCMGRMANCYAGHLQRRFANTIVIVTMRTGKRLPWLFRRSLQRVRHVIANSHDAAAVLRNSYAVPSAKLSVIYNSLVFPAEQELARNDALRVAHAAAPSTTVLLCVAMFRPEKNQRELIEIAASFPPDLDWQLWLAGDGPARADCEALVETKGLRKRVIFPGFLPNPSTLYSAADIAVHASASESLSNFLIEAQSHGLPAVAYAAQGIAETFVPDRTGWEIPLGDRLAFCAQVIRLAREAPATRAVRKKEAQTFARQTFDTKEQVRRYLELFAQLRQHSHSNQQG